jgi:hypothetical protein
MHRPEPSTRADITFLLPCVHTGLVPPSTTAAVEAVGKGGGPLPTHLPRGWLLPTLDGSTHSTAKGS